jgi:hypothetical protein
MAETDAYMIEKVMHSSTKFLIFIMFAVSLQREVPSKCSLIFKASFDGGCLGFSRKVMTKKSTKPVVMML